MRITKIKRLISFGRMENIEMICEVSEDENVGMAADYLETEIKKQIYKIEQKKKDEYEAWELKYKMENPDCEEMPF